MFRRVIKTSSILGFFTQNDPFSQDILSKSTKTEQQADQSCMQNETGWDRLREMTQTDEYGNVNREVATILNVGAISLFIGAVYGGFMNSKGTYVEFIKNNQATVFTDPYEAKKKLRDAITVSFGKGAFKWSWRLAYFCTTYAGISTSISAFRGKSGIIEHVVAGTVTGTLYKFNMGPKGWVAGGSLGMLLGLIAGSVTFGLLKLSGMSMEEVRYWQHHWQEERKAYVIRGMTEYIAKEEEGMLYQHDQKLGPTGNTLDPVKIKTQTEL